jgi:hypothetical protein
LSAFGFRVSLAGRIVPFAIFDPLSNHAAPSPQRRAVYARARLVRRRVKSQASYRRARLSGSLAQKKMPPMPVTRSIHSPVAGVRSAGEISTENRSHQITTLG